MTLSSFSNFVVEIYVSIIHIMLSFEFLTQSHLISSAIASQLVPLHFSVRLILGLIFEYVTQNLKIIELSWIHFPLCHGQHSREHSTKLNIAPEQKTRMLGRKFSNCSHIYIVSCQRCYIFFFSTG